MEVEAQYLQALDLLLSHDMRDRATADALLHDLGLRWRLADPVWSACSSTSSPLDQERRDCATQLKQQLTTPLVFPSHLSDPLAIQQPLPHLDHNQQQQHTDHAQQQQHDQQPQPHADHHAQQQQHDQQPPFQRQHTHSLLAPDLLSALQTAFDPHTSPFWQDHAYHDPCTPFVSYVHDLREKPSNIVELAAQTMWAGLSRLWGAGDDDSSTGVQTERTSTAADRSELRADQAAADRPEPKADPASKGEAPYSNVTHVEWWAHTREEGGYGHQLHFDCDETKLRKGAANYRLIHPQLSSVVFLSGAAQETAENDPGGEPSAFKHSASVGGDGPDGGSPNAFKQSVAREERGVIGGLNTFKQSVAVGGPTVLLQQWPGMGGTELRNPQPNSQLDLHKGGDVGAQRQSASHAKGGDVQAGAAAAAGKKDGSLAQRCWCVHPAVGQVLLFPGNFLHGVLPSKSGRRRARAEEALLCASLPSEQSALLTDQQQQSPTTVPSAQAQQQQQQQLQSVPSAKSQQQQRTTLVLVWWSCEDRGCEREQHPQHHAQEQQQQQPQHLQPQMIPPTRAWLDQASRDAQLLLHTHRMQSAARAKRELPTSTRNDRVQVKKHRVSCQSDSDLGEGVHLAGACAGGLEDSGSSTSSSSESSDTGESESSSSELSEETDSHNAGGESFTTLPEWSQLFVRLMLGVQEVARRGGPTATSNGPPLCYTPAPINPAWTPVEVECPASHKPLSADWQRSIAPLIPDLRFCIPHASYFNDLYPLSITG